MGSNLELFIARSHQASTMIDCQFPIIRYPYNQTPRQRGQAHGESFKSAIRELYEIRLGLMRNLNPAWTAEKIHDLASQQWQSTFIYDADLTDELQGICDGSGLSHEEIIVLNNYTDFRDISLPDEGCSAAYIQYDGRAIAGQTWDMHGSAKNYVCCISLESASNGIEQVLFSLVGCVGMMGYTQHGTMVGINNINTDGGIPGVAWPVVVRKILQSRTVDEITNRLVASNVAGGHNYMVGSTERGEMWEVMPGLAELVDCTSEEVNYIFHTNHCLGHNSTHRELKLSANSTTHIRYGLLEKKMPAVRDYDSFMALLNDHENYPKSICSNWQSNSQDPSITCGGGLGDLNQGRVQMWRGDREHDDNFVMHEFQLDLN